MIAGATVGVPSGTATGTSKVGWMCVRAGPVFATPPDCGTEYLGMIVTFPVVLGWRWHRRGRPSQPPDVSIGQGLPVLASGDGSPPRASRDLRRPRWNRCRTLLGHGDGSPPGASVHADSWTRGTSRSCSASPTPASTSVRTARSMGP